MVLIAATGILLSSANQATSSMTLVEWNWTISFDSGIAGMFNVIVANEKETNVTAEIICTATFENGDKYTNTKEVTLAPGEQTAFIITVAIPSIHYGETAIGYCRLA